LISGFKTGYNFHLTPPYAFHEKNPKIHETKSKINLEKKTNTYLGLKELPEYSSVNKIFQLKREECHKECLKGD